MHLVLFIIVRGSIILFNKCQGEKIWLSGKGTGLGPQDCYHAWSQKIQIRMRISIMTLTKLFNLLEPQIFLINNISTLLDCIV